jgi:hypothetical protein
MSAADHQVKVYYQGSGKITAPIVMKPAQMTRKQWRALKLKARRVVEKHAKEQARRPESEQLDDRLHAAGLLSPRDAAAVVPVRFGTQVLGA